MSKKKSKDNGAFALGNTIMAVIMFPLTLIGWLIAAVLTVFMVLFALFVLLAIFGLPLYLIGMLL
jgi:hypothetical protein